MKVTTINFRVEILKDWVSPILAITLTLFQLPRSVSLCIGADMLLYVCIYVYMYVCIYVYVLASCYYGRKTCMKLFIF